MQAIGLQPRTSSLAPLKTLRHKDAILDRQKKTSSIAFRYNFDAMSICSNSKSSWRSNMEMHSLFPRGTSPSSAVSAPSSAFLSGDQGTLKNIMPVLPRRLRFSKQARAHNDIFHDSQLPKMTEKPKWWMRTLACLSYLIALQMSDTGFYLQRFLEYHENLEDVLYYIPGAVNRLPTWFPMIYCYFGYIGVVKNEDLPHFFRYHMMMAMLLEIALQIVWYSSNFAPLIHFKGTFAMHYWAAVGFFYIVLLLECIRCALGGKYVEIPFLKESAITQTKYTTKGFKLF